MISSNVYIVDFKKLVEWCEATFLRRPKYMGYLKSLIKPLQNLHEDFIAFKDDSTCCAFRKKIAQAM